MAHTDTFPGDVLDTVAAELGNQLGVLGGPHIQRGGKVEIGETFAVWMLGADAVTKSSADITQLATPTGQWHHQVRYGAQAHAFARSIPTGPAATDWSVRSLFESDIAKKIDSAIDWVDNNVKDDPLVRLLICPAFYVHAFWLVGKGTSHILVVDMPDQFTHLKYTTIYTPREFLENLAKENYSPGIA